MTESNNEANMSEHMARLVAELVMFQRPTGFFVSRADDETVDLHPNLEFQFIRLIHDLEEPSFAPRLSIGYDALMNVFPANNAGEWSDVTTWQFCVESLLKPDSAKLHKFMKWLKDSMCGSAGNIDIPVGQRFSNDTLAVLPTLVAVESLLNGSRDTSYDNVIRSALQWAALEIPRLKHGREQALGYIAYVLTQYRQVYGESFSPKLDEKVRSTILDCANDDLWGPRPISSCSLY